MKVFTQLACGKRQIGPVNIAEQSKHKEEQYEMSADFLHHSLRVDLFKSNSKETNVSLYALAVQHPRTRLLPAQAPGLDTH